MKSIWREIVLSLIMGMILPGILLNWAVEEQDATDSPQVQEPLPSQPTAAGLEVRVRKGEEETVIMDMDAYLAGVILAEMPSTFHFEAKKAQAVAARTFAWKAWVTGGKHGDGSVCTDPGCCQAYIGPESFLEKGGTQKALEQAGEAARATSGYVLYYQGNLIEATYFSCSGGFTEDAVAVWGTDVAYLKSMPSPGEESAVHYTDTAEISVRELEEKLGVTLTGDENSWFRNMTYTAGGGVETVTIGGVSFRGTELRSRLGLRSTAFTITARDGVVTFETRGFGHRVGMSQYGADAMAARGYTYQQILAHYYQGTTLELTNGQV